MTEDDWRKRFKEADLADLPEMIGNQCEKLLATLGKELEKIGITMQVSWNFKIRRVRRIDNSE